MSTTVMIGVGLFVVGLIASAATLTAYAGVILPFITNVPTYIGQFIGLIIAFIPSYVYMPLMAMFALLVSYLMIHLFSKFMNNLPGG